MVVELISCYTGQKEEYMYNFINLIKISLITLIIICIVMPLLSEEPISTNTPQPEIKIEEKTKPQNEAKTVESHTSQPVYKTFGSIKLKEVYTYPKLGFYAYEYSKTNASLELEILEIMTKTLKYSDEGWLDIYIYDKKANVTPFLNAPKQVPANLMFEADKQKPYVRFISSKDHSDYVCAYIYPENRAIYYFRSFATGWNWTQPEDESGNCQLYNE